MSEIRTDWICEKWSEDACIFARRRLYLPKVSEVSSAMLRDILMIPAEIVDEVPGNLLLNEGIQQMLDLLTGAVTTNKFDNANSRIGVGDSSTAEAATQTDLQAATNKTYKAMNATFPSRANQTVSFQSDFTTAEANYVWNEWMVDNGSGPLKSLNRKVASLGTKTTGTWTLTGTITIS